MENLQSSDNEVVNSYKQGRGQYERKPRGSYQKHKLEKKITIKHSVNKALKPQLLNGFSEDEYLVLKERIIRGYPVYVRLNLKGQTTYLPSESFHNQYELEDKDLDKKRKEYDISVINWILDKLKPFDRDDFSISEFVNIYKLVNKNISELVNQSLIKEYTLIDSLFKSLNTHKSSFSGRVSNMDLERRIQKELESRYKSDIWVLGAYEQIYQSRGLRNGQSKPYNTYLVNSNPFSLMSFLMGNYEKYFIEEFGGEIVKPIIEDIYILLRKNLKEFKFI